MGTVLQATQIEAHIGRLTSIRTQLTSYPDDGRAVTAIPMIDAVIGVLGQEPFAPVSDIEQVQEPEPDDDGSRNTADAPDMSSPRSW